LKETSNTDESPTFTVINAESYSVVLTLNSLTSGGHIHGYYDLKISLSFTGVSITNAYSKIHLLAGDYLLSYDYVYSSNSIITMLVPPFIPSLFQTSDTLTEIGIYIGFGVSNRFRVYHNKYKIKFQMKDFCNSGSYCIGGEIKDCPVVKSFYLVNAM
jgi:hypothetical protein